MIVKLVITAGLLIASIDMLAQLKVASIFTNDMVLQRDKPIAIWGTATPGETIQAKLGLATAKTIATSNGDWKLIFAKQIANANTTLTISTTTEQKAFTNIAIGEVWVCSGQSNMEFTMSAFTEFYKDEITASTNTNIRYVTVEKTYDNVERKEANIKVPWQTLSPSTIGDCSAVAYFFAKQLQQKLQVPVGLVLCAWGGTPAQSWVDTKEVTAFTNYAKTYKENIAPINFTEIEQTIKKRNETFRENVIDQAAKFKTYTSVDYNDADWETKPLPGVWEGHGYADYDGIGAYRVIFNVSESDAGKIATLHLPAIDDIDSTYLNGKFLGSKQVYNVLRTYEVPQGVLQAGKNVITIWVEDGQGGGGLNNDPDNYFMQIGTNKIPLSGNAKMKMLLPMQQAPGFNLNAMQYSPCVLFNGMIAPLLPMTIKGVIWYQGESNADKYEEYRTLFPALINNWRNRWQQKDLPFLFAQLSSYNPAGVEPEISNWAFLREAQSMALKLPATGMAVTIDVGDKNDIHPKQKKQVGERLAANAFKVAYDFGKQISHGPYAIKSINKKNSIAVLFSSAGKGLTYNGEFLKGFSIAGTDKKFYNALAKIQGNNMVIISSSKVATPMYVRYAWAEAPMEANLFNQEGFPAAPFRTDK
jgi:sialate O-acetylesterase